MSEWIIYIVCVISVLTAICIYLVCRSIVGSENITERAVKSKNKLLLKFYDAAAHDRINDYFHKLDVFFSEFGLNYMIGRPVYVHEYLFSVIILAALCMIFTYQLALTQTQNDLICIFAAIVGFCSGLFLPRIILKISNDADNDNMLPDIKAIFNTLKIRCKAGVYITDALAESYKIIRSRKNKRLYDALCDLSSEINASKDIEAAIENFNLKFRNEYIDILCITIEQALKSGQTIKLLDDIYSQITDMEGAIHLKEEEKLQRKMQVIEVLIFGCMIAITAWCCFTEFSKVFSGF